MKKKFLSLLLLGGLTLTAGAQQLPNIGFSNWKTASGSTEAFGTGGSTSSQTGEMRQRPGVEPTDWNGSSVNQKVVLTAKKELVTNDNNTVKMQNARVEVLGIGDEAPGFINLGTPWVYAVSTISECDGGAYGGIEFTYKPDAITGRYKRTDTTGETSRIIAYLWSGTFVSNVGSKSSPNQARDNVDRAILGKETPTSSGTLIASCDYTFTSTTNSDWQTITVPLTYHNTTTTPSMMNTIISAGDYWNRDNVIAGTTLYADDVKFVYYSTLKSLSYNGETLTIPAVDTTLDMSTVVYDESKLSCTSGQSATIEPYYDYATAKLTITVSNVDADIDGLSSHTYYIQFAKPGTAALTDLKYNGTTLAGFSSSTYEYTLEGSKYTDGCLTYTKEDGEEATAKVSFTGENGYGVATITVNAIYGGATKTYTVNFLEPLALLTASFNGTALTVDAESMIEVDAVYSADNWAFTTSGSNARVLKKYFVDYGLLSLIVMQFDADDQPTDKYKEYYYQFRTPVNVTTYNENLTVSFAENTFTSTSPIKIAEMPNDTYILALSDFELDGLPVGDIVVDGLTKETINGIETFKSNGSTTIEKTIQIAPGNNYGYETYLGPVLGDVPISMQTENYDEYFHTVIAINMEESLGYNIDVTAGTDIVAQTQSAALTETGEAHVVLNRQFLEGWNTICLPFATTPEAVAGTGAVAQAFDDADANGLDFVVAETMEANTPYLIYVPANTAEQTFIANVTLEEAAPASVTYGDYTFKGNYEANMPMADLYGVADKDGVQKIMKGSAAAKLQGTRAYFDYSGQSNVSGMRINLEGEGGVTSIDGVQVLSGSCDVYNLQGIRVRTAATSLEGLTPGIYVVNGKKVMVK